MDKVVKRTKRRPVKTKTGGVKQVENSSISKVMSDSSSAGLSETLRRSLRSQSASAIHVSSSQRLSIQSNAKTLTRKILGGRKTKENTIKLFKSLPQVPPGDDLNDMNQSLSENEDKDEISPIKAKQKSKKMSASKGSLFSESMKRIREFMHNADFTDDEDEQDKCPPRRKQRKRIGGGSSSQFQSPQNQGAESQPLSKQITLYRNMISKMYPESSKQSQKEKNGSFNDFKLRQQYKQKSIGSCEKRTAKEHLNMPHIIQQSPLLINLSSSSSEISGILLDPESLPLAEGVMPFDELSLNSSSPDSQTSDKHDISASVP